MLSTRQGAELPTLTPTMPRTWAGSCKSLQSRAHFTQSMRNIPSLWAGPALRGQQAEGGLVLAVFRSEPATCAETGRVLVSQRQGGCSDKNS